MDRRAPVILPEQLIVSSYEGYTVHTYSSTEDLKNITENLNEYIFVCYEDHFSEYKEVAKDAFYLILISFKREFMQFSHNIFFINGEKLNTYNLFLMFEMIRINHELKSEILENYRIGIDLSAEKDMKKLWEKILSFSRKSTHAEAGTLFMLKKKKDAITFLCSQNERFNMDEIKEVEIPFNNKSLVGYVCSTGKTLNIKDAYNLPDDLPYKFNPKIDEELHYHTQSIITIPMVTPHGDIIGAVQLINKKTVSEMITGFSNYDELLLRSIASLSAVAIENNRLYDEISGLFDSFIFASTKAIEQRDPATKGHSERVARYTMGLMALVNESDLTVFKGVKFTPHDVRSAEVAAILHDFGKVGIREKLLIKQNKLFYEDYEKIRGRALYIKVSLEKQAIEMKLLNQQPDIDFITTFVDKLDELNMPSPLTEENEKFIQEAMGKKFTILDEVFPLLTGKEAENLLIGNGSLTPDERLNMENHVIYSYEIIKAMKWPYEMENVPDYVINHHEKLDGSGYPFGKTGKELGLIDRIIAISDIYDALTASDRTYKRSFSPEIALKIIEEEVTSGRLDSEIFSLLKNNLPFVLNFEIKRDIF